jgi:hypothetical protein
MSLDQITLTMWLELLDTTFLVQTATDAPVELSLMKVNQLHHAERPLAERPNPATTAIESFSLIFRGSGNHPLPQKTYHFEHPNLARFDLFIVPIGRTGNEWEYEAVLNRVVKPV